MSCKRFGAVAGLLTGLLIVPGELEEAVNGRTDIFGYGGSDYFGVVNAVLVVDSTGVADVGGRARNARSYLPENDPVIEYHANIPSTASSNIVSNPIAVDPLSLQSAFDEGNTNAIGTRADAPVHRSVFKPAVSSRGPKSRSLATPTLRPAGCAQCGGEVARATAGRAKSFAALFLRTFSGKGGSVRQRHPVTGIGRERDRALLAASTIPRGWRMSSL